MTYVVTFKTGRHNIIDMLASKVDGRITAGAALFDGRHDLAHVEVGERNAKCLEAMLKETESVIEYRVA